MLSKNRPKFSLFSYFCIKTVLFTPIKSFVFLLSCLVILAIVLLWQSGKTYIITQDVSFKFFDLNSYLDLSQTNNNKVDSVKKIIKESLVVEKQVNEDSISLQQNAQIDTLKVKNALKPLQIDKDFISKIEYPNNNKNIFKKFFDALKNANDKNTHILYYGDSQIEEDRFSGFMREKFQAHFGGSGCGWIPFMPIAQWISPKISYSKNWIKWYCYARYPSKTEIYGPMAQTFLFDPTQGKGTISITCNTNIVNSNCQFNKIKLFYGYSKEPLLIHYYNNNEKIISDTLNYQGSLSIKELAVQSTNSIKFEFEGFESPCFYGLSLESYGNGVYVDNIALRGSSGTFFHLIQKDALKKFLDEQHVSLIILQFGGNAMPMIDSEEKAMQYVKYIDSQIKILKRLSNASVLFVGPSDMCTNQDGKMLTHPYLEIVNTGLKEVSLKIIVLTLICIMLWAEEILCLYGFRKN